ncbi:uncharacterized protein LOC110981150 isoform X2 [Acanthaster planci]|uniref:Uncharacterized protein LOC110981150 isoform X2 n=1 Tax=Acanthaster planci TaxID=133434 RepID=A0A8B7YNA2_ACAPL|nr:uncharacterized protein LOC110981150 isoform X2 [Acanthaster planci]
MDKTRDPAQVRDAILKVFRAMTRSPKGGPAIVVGRKTPTISKTGGVKTATETFHKYQLYDSDDVMISDGMCTPEKQIPKPKKDDLMPEKVAKPLDNETRKDYHWPRTSTVKTHQKEKRRKSRAERSRKARQKQQQVDPHERAEFRKHVKKAKEISSHSRIDKALQDPQPFSVITQSRVTRPVGIYNKGKKSDKVYRAPIHVPDRVKEAVEKGLKEILSTSPTSSLPHAPSYDSLLADRGGTPACNTEKRCPALAIRSVTRSRCSIYANEDLVSDTGTEELPKDPPFVEIATDLMASLDVKMIFPDRDYCEEVQEDLLKIMKQHRVSEGGDCSKTSSYTSGIDVLLARRAEKYDTKSSQTHKLMNDTPPHEVSQTYVSESHHEMMSGPHPELHKGPHPGPHPEPHPGDAVYSLIHSLAEHGSQPELYQRPHPEPRPGLHPGPHPGHTVYSFSQESKSLDPRHLQPQMDGTRLHLPASSVEPVSYHTFVPEEHRSEKPLHTITDNGLEFLRRAEEISELRERTAEERLANEKLASGHAHDQHDLENNHARAYQHVENSSSDILDLITTSHQSLGAQPHLQDSVFRFNHSYSQDQAQRPRYDPAPSHHPDDCLYLTSRNCFQDDFDWVAKPDRLPTNKLFLPEDFRAHDYSRPGKEHLWQGWNSQLKRGRDSGDDSPIWYPTYISPHQKPRMESPSPPKQYPQRMY